MNIKNVVVIGSGTMGSGIAAQLCNANIPVTLLDLKTEISEKAKKKIFESRPPLLIDKSKINISNIKVTGVNSFLELEKILETLNSQVLTFDVSLDELEGDVASISLAHYGDKVDLNNLLIIHSDFKKIKSKSQDIISYNYNKS